MWLHAFKSGCQKVLVYSPDTDTYHIGLPLLQKHPQVHVVMQLNPSMCEGRFLYLQRFISSLKSDPELATVEPAGLAELLQMLYIISGRDYVSFFAGIGKVTFWNIFLANAPFITGHGPLHIFSKAQFKSKFQQPSPVSLFKSLAIKPLLE